MAERELLFSLTKRDFVVETFRAGGKGGQHQNKTDSAVRIRHGPVDAVAGGGTRTSTGAQRMSRRYYLWLTVRLLVFWPAYFYSVWRWGR